MTSKSCMKMVSIHAPARGATFQGRRLRRVQSVSIHAPARGHSSDIGDRKEPTTQEEFQSTLPHGERLMGTSRTHEFETCFNPRSRTGSDLTAASAALGAYVSIHAPARGATRLSWFLSTATLVSIHAPARGATRCYRTFRPAERVSIHAPARGATRSTRGTPKPISWFQSTLPHGERPQWASMLTVG